MSLRNILSKRNYARNVLNVTRNYTAPNNVRNISVICLKTTTQPKPLLTTHPLTLKRPFSSEDKFPENEPRENEKKEEKKSSSEIKNAILDSSLDFVHEHGWSKEALSRGAVAAGYDGVTAGLFEGGGDDLVVYFVAKCNRQLGVYLREEAKKAEESGEKLRVSDFIRDALEFRLRMLIPYLDVWPQAGAILLRPGVAGRSAGELAGMLDDIWFHAGDKSADFNWYTKRALLGKVYVSSQLVMLNDQSPDFENTWQFLDRRLKDVNTMGRFISDVQSTTSFAADIAFEGAKILKTSLGFFDRRR